MKNFIKNIEDKLNKKIDQDSEFFILACMIPVLSMVPISIILANA